MQVRELLEAADVSKQYFARFPEGFCQNGVSDRVSQHAHFVIKVNATRLNRIPNKGRARIEQELPPILEQLIGVVPLIDQEVRDLSVSGNKAIVDVSRLTKVRFHNQVLSLQAPVESLVIEKVSGVWLLDSPRELEFAFRLCHPEIAEIVEILGEFRC